MNAVIEWVEAGRETDVRDFRTADLDGTITDLGDQVGFRSPGRLPTRIATGCMTSYAGVSRPLDTLHCLVPLRDAPARPEGLLEQWIGGWVDFDGATITVGGIQPDPGVFMKGIGNPLAYGDRLKFGDFQCRSDRSGLYCVNYAHHSAMVLGKTLIAFGCTQQVEPPYGVGRMYDC